ncbi:hypothetical protein LXL04_020324 [Taraxacum kok-saghyz]
MDLYELRGNQYDPTGIIAKENGAIKKVMNSETESVMASWRLRTYLKLPWRPLILIDGITVYDLDNQFRIVKHVESWSVNLRLSISAISTY